MTEILTRNTSFIDEFGRERIFQGMNIVNKSPSLPGWTEEDFRLMALDGSNIVRLGCVWSGIEPEPGKYNLAYLDSMRQALDWCEKYGMYAFLDLHQDLYSDFGTGYGDGAPAWASFDGDKLKKIYVIWAEGYFFRKPVHKSFDAFWENRAVNGRGLQDWFCDMLRFTVDYLKDKPALIGFDVFNEPFPGTPGGKVFRNLVKRVVKVVATDPRFDRKKAIKELMGGEILNCLDCINDERLYSQLVDAGKKEIREFDLNRYYPFFKRAAEAIRSVTDKGIIFMENCYYSNLGIPCSTPGLTYNDGTVEKNLAFAPHGYDLTVDTPLTNFASPFRVDQIFNEHERTQDRLNVPVLVGEWGGMVSGAKEYPALEHLIRKYDRNKWSQTYWHYNNELHNGGIGEILARPYPSAVAGEISSYGFDRKRKEFVLHYTGDANIKAPTEVYLGKKPKNILSTAKYTIEENALGNFILKADPTDGRCVIVAEY